MVVQGDVAILENILVLFDKLVGVADNIREHGLGVHGGDTNINKVQYVFVDIFNADVAQLDESVQIECIITVFFHVKERQHFFDESEEDELDDVLVDIGAHVFDADCVGGFQLFQIHVLDRFVEIFDGFGDRECGNLGDKGAEKLGIKKCLDDFGLFDFDAGEERSVVVVFHIDIGIAVDNELEDAFFIFRDGNFDRFPFGFCEFGLVGDVHFLEWGDK